MRFFGWIDDPELGLVLRHPKCLLGYDMGMPFQTWDVRRGAGEGLCFVTDWQTKGLGSDLG